MEWVWITVVTKYKLHIGRNLTFCFAAEAGGPPLLLVLPLSLLALRQTVETCNTLLQPPFYVKKKKLRKIWKLREVRQTMINRSHLAPAVAGCIMIMIVLKSGIGMVFHVSYYTRQLLIVYPTTVFSSVLRLSWYVFVSLLFPYWPIMAIPSQYIISWQRKLKQLVDWSNTSNQVISWLCVNLSKWHCTQRTFDLIVRMWSIQRQAIVSLFLLSLKTAT